MQQQKKEYRAAEIRIIPFHTFDHFLEASGEVNWITESFDFGEIDKE